MPQRLGRRRYQELIKFLKQTVENEAATIKLRMQAAERLASIYERLEVREAKTEDRAYQAELRRQDAAAKGAGDPTDEKVQPSSGDIASTEDQRIREVLSSLGRTGLADGE